MALGRGSPNRSALGMSPSSRSGYVVHSDERQQLNGNKDGEGGIRGGASGAETSLFLPDKVKKTYFSCSYVALSGQGQTLLPGWQDTNHKALSSRQMGGGSIAW